MTRRPSGRSRRQGATLTRRLTSRLLREHKGSSWYVGYYTNVSYAAPDDMVGDYFSYSYGRVFEETGRQSGWALASNASASFTFAAALSGEDLELCYKFGDEPAARYANASTGFGLIAVANVWIALPAWTETKKSFRDFARAARPSDVDAPDAPNGDESEEAARRRPVARA